MSPLSKLKPFFFGLLAVLIAFSIVSVFDYRAKYDGLCMDCDNDFGWPFRVYQSGGLVHATRIIWTGIIANLMTALASGIIIGAICQMMWTLKAKKQGSKMR